MDITSFMPSWLWEHGPAFLIAVPLIMAAVTAVLPIRKISWVTTTLLTAILLIAAIALTQYELANGIPIYPMGGWEPPYGILALHGGAYGYGHFWRCV